MNKGFWEKVPKPCFVLAPMADVTDAAFRRMIAKYGKPDVMWTEFVSVNGLVSKGRAALLRDLEFSEAERPIVAQIFGDSPENFYDVAKLIVELGFDGVDINMGCPDRNVEKQGGGASLIKDPVRATEIIRALQRGIEDAGSNIPVSVKTRIGYNKVEIDTWIPHILETEPAVLTVHARTRKEMSKVPARWEFVARAVELRNQHSPETLVLGNGDVMNRQEGLQRIKETGADGVMIGRGIFGTPWLFSTDSALFQMSLAQRFGIMLEHTELFEKLLGDIKSFAIMKKHYKAYVHGFDGAKELRMELMEASDSGEVRRIVEEWLRNNS